MSGRSSSGPSTISFFAVAVCLSTLCAAAIYAPLLAFALSEDDLCPNSEFSTDLRFLAVGLGIIGLASPFIILCACMLPVTICCGDFSDPRQVHCLAFSRLLGNSVMFGWCIYGMLFVYPDPLFDTCSDPVRLYTLVMMIAGIVGWGLLCCGTFCNMAFGGASR